MSDYRRWSRFSLKSLFLLMLLVATFFAGYSLAWRKVEVFKERAERAEWESQQAAARADLIAEDARIVGEENQRALRSLIQQAMTAERMRAKPELHAPSQLPDAYRYR